jgi:cell division protein FtsW
MIGPAPAKAKLRHAGAKAVTSASVHGPRLLLIITTLALVIFGLVMVYSASFVEAFTNPDYNQDSSYIFRHQLQITGVGLVALVMALAVDYRLWNSIASWIPWGAAVILLVLTLTMGNDALGGKRWFDLFGVSLQPSEFAKIALLLLAGALLVGLRSGRDMRTTSTKTEIAKVTLAVVLPVGLILAQPDLGTTLIIFAGIIAVAWFGELPMRALFIFLLSIVVVGIAAIMFVGFRTARISAWLDPWSNASDGAYQIINSFYALAGGGVGGVGLGMSHQKYLYLPQPHNDLIFPIIGEEFGLIGTVSVVALFLLFLFAAYRIAHNASDLYGRIVAGSAATMIGFQAFLNMLCMVNLLPMTGKPLPFFSAGGSSIITTLILVGLILNVSLRSEAKDRANERRDQLLILEGGRTAAPGVVGAASGALQGLLGSHSAGRQPLPGKTPNKAMLKKPGKAAAPTPEQATLRPVGTLPSQPSQKTRGNAAKTPTRPQVPSHSQAAHPQPVSSRSRPTRRPSVRPSTPSRPVALGRAVAPGRPAAAPRTVAPGRSTAAPRIAAPARLAPTRHTSPSEQTRPKPANPLLNLSPARRGDYRHTPASLAATPTKPAPKPTAPERTRR